MLALDVELHRNRCYSPVKLGRFPVSQTGFYKQIVFKPLKEEKIFNFQLDQNKYRFSTWIWQLMSVVVPFNGVDLLNGTVQRQTETYSNESEKASGLQPVLHWDGQ